MGFKGLSIVIDWLRLNLILPAWSSVLTYLPSWFTTRTFSTIWSGEALKTRTPKTPATKWNSLDKYTLDRYRLLQVYPDERLRFSGFPTHAVFIPQCAQFMLRLSAIHSDSYWMMGILIRGVGDSGVTGRHTPVKRRLFPVHAATEWK
jgi:hypothetical protein